MTMSAMYRAATGMGALSTGMATVSNNLANVNTVGFKAQRANYEDLIYQSYFSSGNHNQVGKGSKVMSIQTIFNQGAFKTAEQDTDIAIAGDGFFNVRTRGGDIMYTRAGAYTIREDGYLEDPSGNILQGWQMSVPKPGQPAVRIGNPVDIKLVTKAPPVATTNVTMIGNLDATAKSSYYYPTTNDWEGMGFAGAWNGQNHPPIARENYSYAESTTIYDEAGNPHDLMIYYQKNPHMENVWDYIVACDPEEDARAGADGSPMFNSKSQLAGLVQKGKLTFDADGRLKDIEADNFDVAGSRPAAVDAPDFTGSSSSQAMQTATIGGYYSGAGLTDPETGQSVSSARTYTLNWGWQDLAAGLAKVDEPKFVGTSISGTMRTATIGGQYAGAATIDPETGQSVSSARSYTVSWGWQDPETGLWGDSNTAMDPPMSGLTWTDDQGNSGFIPISDKNNGGPYSFGSGLTVTFDTGGGQALEFGQPGQDAMIITAHSEQDVQWSGSNTDMKPPMSGITWTDSQGNRGFIPVSDKNYGGPYPFGSGLTVTFDTGGKMLEFGQPGQDAMEVTAHSEQAAWSPAGTNADGHFSFNLSFTRTPMDKLDPPYPNDLETVSQSVGLYMGAKKPYGVGDIQLDDLSMTQYGIKSNTVKTDQDGYPASDLERVSVREDGMVIGIYNKQRQEELYQITITRFRDCTDLTKMGDNLFMPSRFSDEGFDCVPGQDGAGSVLGNFLEQSTVDTATEIVNMIITQRGFQANSKTVTTSDSMLATAIQLKK